MHIKLDFAEDPRPTDHEELVRQYVADRTRDGESVTLRGRLAEIKRFLGTLEEYDVLAWTVRPQTAHSYLTGLQQVCKYRHPAAWTGTLCRKDQDTSRCGRKCPAFEAKAPSTMSKYGRDIGDLYAFMERRGWASGNPFKYVSKDFSQLAGNVRKPPPYSPEPREVERFIEQVMKRAPNRGIHYALCFYYGCRCQESLATSMASLDVESGWLEVGDLLDPTRPHKRKGNARFPVDSRMARYIRILEDWRALKNDPSPQAALTRYAKGALTMERTNLLDRWWRADAVALKAFDVGRLTTHTGRRFYTTQLIRNGLRDGMPEFSLLRGDKLPGRLAEYYSYNPDEVASLYHHYAP